MSWEQTLDEAVAAARQLASPGSRKLLGIAGAPGGGKSTIARAVVDRLAPLACYVPMDGFHLSNAELDRLGRRDRKGAPDTFDAAGYVALLRRLRAGGADTVYAPAYYRGLEEAIAAAVAVPPDVPLVVTEGNYLLLDEGAWAGVRPLLDAVWYVEIDEATRLEQLLRRHITYGKTPDQARAWVHGSDQRNAELVARTRHRADLVVHAAPAQHPGRPPDGAQGAMADDGSSTPPPGAHDAHDAPTAPPANGGNPRKELSGD
ncbi:nucleoside/nucleotide kinase family protein [Nocardioides panaciterrulae]|uniref:Pantothenate kinase n=1 Tax=Nocardioides panaciterrulae TaxID=661492 RepID=A0A7Y9E913_9ACTN|nr:pantothenate kinase [Nocardioides panaciterrulae]